MSRARLDDQLLPSVLDRLIDENPHDVSEPARSRNQVLHQLKKRVRRDLQNLLNTRWRCESWPPKHDEIDKSLLNYGIPDFSGAVVDGVNDAKQLIEAIRRAIDTFEPRFASYDIEIVENKNHFDRTLRFKIEGLLHAEPAPEPVSYDTMLEIATAEFKIRQA